MHYTGFRGIYFPRPRYGYCITKGIGLQWRGGGECMATFAEKLRDLREQRGWTQASLADRSGVPLGTLRDYEQGKRGPLLSNAEKLARALGVSLDVFRQDQVPPGKPSAGL